jgi:hypothetical protein
MSDADVLEDSIVLSTQFRDYREIRQFRQMRKCKNPKNFMMKRSTGLILFHRRQAISGISHFTGLRIIAALQITGERKCI